MAGSGLTGFLQNIGTGEMLVIIIVALVVLGPERLPDMARGAGRMLHRLKTMSSDLQSQMGDVMSDPSMQPIRELGELATRPRQKLTEYMLEAEAEQRALDGTDAGVVAAGGTVTPEDDATADTGEDPTPAVADGEQQPPTVADEREESPSGQRSTDDSDAPAADAAGDSTDAPDSAGDSGL